MEYIRDYFPGQWISQERTRIPTEDIILSMLLDYWF